MSSSAEAQRDREVQCYLQSWQVAQGSSFNVANNVDNIAAPNAQDSGFKPKASSDKALTAFAQLAVFRLNVKRAMISLLDDSSQIILAEATRNLRLGNLRAEAAASQAPASVDRDGHRNASDNGDLDSDLWLGTSVLNRADAICEHCFINTCTAVDPDSPPGTKPYTAQGLIISDCRLDPRFQTRPYVVSEPGVRFYAGVPIISRKGHRIGIYSVSDDKPRDGLTADEVQFMQSVAQASMEHFEWARDRVDRFKGERIVRGLASFIEGCSTLSDDSSLTKDELPRSPSTLRPPKMTLGAKRRLISRTTSCTRPVESEPELGPKPNSRSSSRSAPAPESQRATNQQKPDGLHRMFHRASEILRDATLADGVVLFGATASDASQVSRAVRTGSCQSDDDDPSHLATSGSEGVGLDSSDSDTSPLNRPCKLLACSLADEKARAAIEHSSPLSLGTLDKYFSRFPRGKTLSFTAQGKGVSSEDDSASDLDRSAGRGRRRDLKMDHKELLKKIPGAQVVVFLPLYDYVEDRLAGGCFLWTSALNRMMNLDHDLSYLRAFGNSIMNQAARIDTQRNEAAKTTFIASMSHELRSPLHGILGASEFLKDTNTDSYQSGLIDSIASCGKTLLDTLNHVLDYSKINKLGRLQIRRGAKHNKLINLSSGSLESLNMTTVVDVGILVEEVIDAIATGHGFTKFPGSYFSGAPRLHAGQGTNSDSSNDPQSQVNHGPVSVLLDICPKTCWMVRSQPGALGRIIMNLFGNALKYTSAGFVLVSLYGQESADGSEIDVLLRVVDTGKGMSEEYQQDRLFVPFSQEDSFQPGTGLGLSIVKQIVTSLGGTLEIKSQQHKGTEVDVRLSLKLVRDEPQPPTRQAISSVAQQTRGLNLVVLEDNKDTNPPVLTQQARMLDKTLIGTCSGWFGMRASKEKLENPSDADFYMYAEPPSIQTLEKRFKNNKQLSSRHKKIPIIIICLNAEEAVKTSQNHSKSLGHISEIIELIPQPCGPRKLSKALQNCMERVDKMKNETRNAEKSPSVQYDEPGLTTAKLPEVILAPPSPLPPDPALPSLYGEMQPLPPAPAGPDKSQDTKPSTTHVLLVDDNKINLQLLVMFMKKCEFSYEEAENGQEAVDKYKEAYGPDHESNKRRFDYILMDISMPVMNGMEATRHIREFERAHSLPLTNVIALTGLASADARREAISAGVDVFLPKPVRFAELKKLLRSG